MTDRIIIKTAGALAGLAVVAAIVLVAGLFGLVPDRWFWIDFFAFLLAGLVVTGTVGLVWPRYLDWLNRPQVTVELVEGGRLSRYLDGRIKGTVRLSVRNLGSRPLRGFAWHLFLPAALKAQVKTVEPQGEERMIGERDLGGMSYVQGEVSSVTIYPGAAHELPIKIWCDTADSRSVWSIGCALNTETGPWPLAFGQHRQADLSAAADCHQVSVPVEIKADPPVSSVG